MSKVYDIAFRMGVLFNVTLWTILNVMSFLVERNKFIGKYESPLNFGMLSGFSWGLPFEMFRNYFLADEYLVALNAVIYVACGFFFGFLFKFVWSKISRHRAALK